MNVQRNIQHIKLFIVFNFYGSDYKYILRNNTPQKLTSVNLNLVYINQSFAALLVCVCVAILLLEFYWCIVLGVSQRYFMKYFHIHPLVYDSFN